MLDKFVGDTIASAPALAGVSYETINDGTVSLVMEAPELGRRVFVRVDQMFDDGLEVLRLHTTRCVEGEPEPPGEVIQQGLAELRRRWPEIVVQIHNTREGVNLDYETRIVRRRAAVAEATMELAQDFVTVLPRLRDCVVRSFVFMNVLCVASQVDVRLLEGAQDFALKEWEFVQDCGGLDSMRQCIDELCDMLDATREDVLSAAVTALRQRRLREESAAVAVPETPQPAATQAVDVAGALAAVPPAVAAEPIGLTLEELISYGP
jgi:hypothetical protein